MHITSYATLLVQEHLLDYVRFFSAVGKGGGEVPVCLWAHAHKLFKKWWWVATAKPARDLSPAQHQQWLDTEKPRLKLASIEKWASCGVQRTQICLVKTSCERDLQTFMPDHAAAIWGKREVTLRHYIHFIKAMYSQMCCFLANSQSSIICKDPHFRRRREAELLSLLWSEWRTNVPWTTHRAVAWITLDKKTPDGVIM